MNVPQAQHTPGDGDGPTRPETPVWLDRAAYYFAACALVLALSGLFIVYFARCAWPPVRSDGIGYYAYLPALFIQHDPSFDSLAPALVSAEAYPVDNPDVLPEWTGILKYEETGRYLNKYPMGVAVMMTPFFLATHGVALLFEQPADGFSPLYQFSAVLAGLCYAIFGLLLLQQFLERRYGKGPALATVVVIFLGTNFFHYATYDSMFSHAFAFFLVVVLMRQTERWHERPGVGGALILGLIVGLLAMVRNPNLIYGLMIPFYGALRRDFFVEKFRFWVMAPWRPLVIGAGAVLGFLPQMIYWKYSADQFLVQAYQGEWFDFLNPEILNVLFSVRAGIFFWAPLLLLSVAGLFTPKFRRSRFFLPVIGVFLAQLYLVSSWWAWWFGGCFGHRAFIDCYPLLAVPMAALFASTRRSWVRWTLAVVCALFILLQMIHMIQYWKHIMPFDQLDWEGYKIIFMRLMKN